MTIVCQHIENYEGEGYYGVWQYHYRRYLLHKLILRSPPLFRLVSALHYQTVPNIVT